ncbi:MAG: hypothetical protein LUF92_17565 [Clostridiales bacterium]|nr:hypothetical protein [Clostridiales bacterium]
MVTDEIYDRYLLKPAVYDRYYRKQLEERKRMAERSEEINDFLDSGQRYIDKIHEATIL